jgi:hypothetical protein
MYSFGRLYAPDARDQPLMSPAVRVSTARQKRPARKVHRLLWHGNQGDKPHCIGYAWYALLRAAPVLNREPLPDPLYFDAQKHDNITGTDYDGTTVRGGAKALQKVHHKLMGYGFTNSVEDVCNWLAFYGPCVWGTRWYEDMLYPDATGLVQVSGSVVGHHAYAVLGHDDRQRVLICQNSWGLAYGKRGRFLLRYEDAQRLLDEDGEACAPTELLPAANAPVEV